MKDRLLTIGGGLLAFALAVMLLVPVERDDGDGISRPLTSDRGPAGLQGLRRWLDEGGVETEVLTRRYSTLASSLDRSPQGNLLIISLPEHTPSRSGERNDLLAWLAQGNDALLLVAAGDAPGWAWRADDASANALLEQLGFTLERAESGVPAPDPGTKEPDRETEPWRVLERQTVELRPLVRHPLTRDVDTVSSRSYQPGDGGWHLTGAAGARLVLPLLGESGNGAAFWEARVGLGRLWLSRYSDLFSNARLGEADNARLMANLLAASLGRNGRVIFDDMHQGATDLYDPRAFFSDPRFMNTIIVMVAFWLLYLVGRSRRLAPPCDSVPRYYAADLARAMAGFFARRLSPVTVEQQLFAFFFNDIRERHGLPTNGQPVWSMLSGMSRVPADDLNALRTHYERASGGRRSNLVALARIMQRTRENLL